jgi:hypothetical protein
MKTAMTYRGRMTLILAAALSSTACERIPQTPSGSAPAERAYSAATQACPAEDFEHFLAAFAGNVSIQKAFTARPLRSDSIDASADPEPRPVTRMLNDADIDFPVIVDLRQLRDEGATVRTSATSATEMKVTIFKQDTDLQMSFYFRKNGCWQLYRLQDDSL